MQSRIVRGVVRLFIGVVLGVAAGALYAGLVGAVHLGAYGRWGGIAVFAGLCILIGALCGLLGGLRWALSGGDVWVVEDRRSPTRGSRHFGPARGTCYPATGGEYPAHQGRFAWLCRGFETRN
jgi:hypothetical protein